MSQFAFGAGNMYATPITDAWGNAIANPTPIPLMVLQEGHIDLSGDLKELFGQNQFAVAVGRGKVKMGIKVKPARIFAAGWNALFFGQTLTAGIFANYTDTIGDLVPPAAVGGVTGVTVVAGGTTYATGDIVQVNTGTSTVKAQGVVTASAGVVTGVQVINSGSYTVSPTASGATTAITGSGSGLTVTCTCTASGLIAYPSALGVVGNGEVFVADLGVINNATGMPLKRVASAPATGQYTCNPATGIYVFSSADAGNTVLVNFQYTNALLTSASRMTVQNLPMGYAPSLKFDLTVSYLGKMTTFSFPMAIPNKMTIGFKNEDFAVPEFDLQAFDPGNGQVMTWSTSE
jgi:hypothetical protein